jgi:hypothetical protein
MGRGIVLSLDNPLWGILIPLGRILMSMGRNIFQQRSYFVHSTTLYTFIQGARGIVARFLKLSPASAVSPIMTKFSQYTPPPLHLLLSSGVHLPARLKGPHQENQRAVVVKIIRAG